MSAPPKKRLSRKERRLQRQNGEGVAEKLNFTLRDVIPLTENQKLTFEAYRNNKNLMLHGIAGTGKSYISLYLALNQILNTESVYKKIYIIRSIVPVRDMGFLPGTNKEKAKVYEAPYYAICSELFGRGDAYEYLKSKNMIEFMSTSFIRGTTLNDCIVIMDEMQNATFHELDSVVTRVGRDCKIIFSGDFTQSDFTNDKDRMGITQFIKIIKNIRSFKFVEFNKNDILRSDLVRDYIIEKDRLGIGA